MIARANLLIGSCGEGLWEAPLLRNGDTSYLHHSPVAPALIKQIKYWMATCDKHHPDCKLEDGAIRSLRLIDVGPPNGKHQPRLKDKLSEGRKYKYITLSYRWGDPSSDMLTTTSETLEERKAGIPMDILPKTMRDAVVITRKLGIRYLWIDALCILQDSRTDWEEQSANMADIYSKATLSISAHEADDAHSGFLWFRDPLESRGCIHPSLAQGRPVVICPKLIDPEEGIAHSIISQRGWTLQEQILPHRILHWGPHEVSWECRTMRASERRPIGEKKRSRFSFSENSAASMELRHDWVGLIENYSRRRLTKPTDKLPAIAGLACSFHQLFSPPPTYLAGLWYEMAVPYLGWHTDMVWNCTRNRTSSGGSVVPDSTCEMHSNMPETSRTPAYPVRMPAFSWVSTDCPIKWAMWAPNAADKYMAETVSHSVKLAGQSRFGAVESSSLTLRGYVKPLRFSEYIANKLYDRFQVYLDRDDVDLEYLEKDCILFHLFCTATQPFHRCSRGWGRETVSQHSLILLREVSKGPDVFRRIGLVRKNFHGGGGPQEVPHSAYTDIEAEFGDWTKTVIVLI